MKKIVMKSSFTNFLLRKGNENGIRLKYYYLAIAMVNIIKIAKNWPIILFKKIFKKSSEPILVKLRNGINIMTSNPADLSMLTEIWVIEEYTPKGFEISKDDVVIDIGAHLGFFSLYAAKRAYIGKVYCFEPLPHNFSILNKNIRNNNFKNISAHNYAVASDSSWRDFYPYEGHSGCHSLYNRGFNKKICVKTISLTDIFKNYNLTHCDFLKMDCEGAEFEILLNTKSSVLKKINIIVGELHEDIQQKYSTKDLVKHLKSNKFHVVVQNGCFYARNLDFGKAGVK